MKHAAKYLATKDAPKVFLIYQEAASGLAALKELQGIFTRLGLEHSPTLDTHVIHADWLMDDVRRLDLQVHLNEAEIVAVSFPGDAELPEHWKSLFSRLMKKNRRTLVLVTFLVEGNTSRENETYFRNLAADCRMEFISYLPSEKQSQSLTSLQDNWNEADSGRSKALPHLMSAQKMQS